jgi:predicted nucleotide-binding protein (sugar kinase/HSP70/actin superfamily)
MQKRIREADEIMRGFRLYEPAVSIFDKAKYAAETLDLANQFGEAWMIAAEVACFARNGVNRVVCIQPFGCIANHVVAKGVERRLKQLYPDMNLLYLDVDGGTAEVNLRNRLHFMMEQTS